MASDVTLTDLMSMQVNQYFTLISITLVVYDYYLTFAEEVDRFWMGGPLNWASGLFYLNRYVVLVGHIPVMVEFFWKTTAASKMQSYHQYLAIAIQLIVASMLIMRMYALYERRRRVLGLYICVSLVVAGIGLWAVLGAKDTHGREVNFPVGCSAALTHDERLGAAWTGMLVFDALVFGMTLYKSLALVRSSPEINLLTVLLRDGAVMMASNLGNILTFLPFTRGVVTTFTNVISSVMISRLMLNLRDPALVRHTAKSGPMLTEDRTFPNLTFVEPTFSTVQSAYGAGEYVYEYPYRDSEGSEGPQSGRRIREVYDYLAMGTSRKAADVELAAVRRG
ncbi:hypothetical protein HYPSUDRAFT_67659 [Hypholoma sublateritium FD-334 SS-4]|uniref:DUF6533 domain-containing protein n=1 Tax=Hypholoma sublateritium (strain FD-334 SS-4) TaxID=945553 RepID=A0A0D2PNR0_HYPSF|nr:hypothetical protein HYPSUDRAFT_67659 [Hypholoma sublateritium FD-334 SS-4]